MARGKLVECVDVELGHYFVEHELDFIKMKDNCELTPKLAPAAA
jgi:hypothetical protein